MNLLLRLLVAVGALCIAAQGVYHADVGQNLTVIVMCGLTAISTAVFKEEDLFNGE